MDVCIDRSMCQNDDSIEVGILRYSKSIKQSYYGYHPRQHTWSGKIMPNTIGLGHGIISGDRHPTVGIDSALQKQKVTILHTERLGRYFLRCSIAESSGLSDSYACRQSRQSFPKLYWSHAFSWLSLFYF